MRLSSDSFQPPALFRAPLCPVGHLPHEGGDQAGRNAFANHQHIRTSAEDDARGLPPRGGDVRQDRGGREGTPATTGVELQQSGAHS